MEKSNYPMDTGTCGARTRSGEPCRLQAMKNGRCRFHGGKSLSGVEHGRYKDGRFTKEAKAARRQLADLMRDVRELMKRM